MQIGPSISPDLEDVLLGYCLVSTPTTHSNRFLFKLSSSIYLAHFLWRWQQYIHAKWQELHQTTQHHIPEDSTFYLYYHILNYAKLSMLWFIHIRDHHLCWLLNCCIHLFFSDHMVSVPWKLGWTLFTDAELVNILIHLCHCSESERMALLQTEETINLAQRHTAMQDQLQWLA